MWFSAPAAAFVIGPALESEPERWEAVGAPADFTADVFRPRVITLHEGAGEAGKGLVFVRRRTAVDRDTTDARQPPPPPPATAARAGGRSLTSDGARALPSGD